MNKVITKLALIVLFMFMTTLSQAQIATAGSSQFSVEQKGTMVRAEKTLGRNGTENMYIVCEPSNKVCFKISATEAPASSGESTDVLDIFPVGTEVEIEVEGTSYSGKLLDYHNQMHDGNLLIREHIIRLDPCSD